MWNSAPVGALETGRAPMTAVGIWGRGRAPASAVELVRREMTLIALVIQAVWILATPDLRTDVTAPEGRWALAILIVGWASLLVAQVRGSARLRWVRSLDVGAVVLAAVVVGAPALLHAGDGPVDGSWETAASLIVLGGLLIGALIEVRAAVVALALLVLVSLEPSFRLATPGLPAIAVPAYTLVVGSALLGVRSLLERNARRIDLDTSHRDDIERQQRTVEGVEAALRRQERLLHETVLNTLTAIDRGGLGRDAAMEGALHDRCREAVDVLSGLESGAQALGPAVTVTPLGFVGVGDDLIAFIDGLRADGLDVELVVDSLEDVPERVLGALLTAIREALTNVARHAYAHRAWVLVRVRRQDRLSVRVEVRDDGIGFDPRTAQRRFGLDRAIVGPLEEVGGRADVQSRPGGGTKILLDWSSRAGDALDRPASASGRFALPPVATFGLYLAATAALAWLQFGHPALTLSDAALVVALGVLIALATPEAPLTWGLVITISALGPLFALLEASGADSVFGGGWALASIAALFMAASAIGPPWGGVPLLASWLVIDGDPIATLLQPATLVVVGGAVFGRSLRRDTEAMVRARRQRMSAVTALEVTRESLSRLRSRYGPLEDSEAIALLTGIAEGVLDPEDPAARRRAGLEEGFIRSLVRIDPGTDALRGLVSELVREAHARRMGLRADLALPPAPAVVVPPGIAESFRRAVAAAAPEEPARLMARAEGDQVVVTLLAAIPEGEQDLMRTLPLPGHRADPDDPSDLSMLWEARLPAGGAT